MPALYTGRKDAPKIWHKVLAGVQQAPIRALARGWTRSSYCLPKLFPSPSGGGKRSLQPAGPCSWQLGYSDSPKNDLFQSKAHHTFFKLPTQQCFRSFYGLNLSFPFPNKRKNCYTVPVKADYFSFKECPRMRFQLDVALKFTFVISLKYHINEKIQRPLRSNVSTKVSFPYTQKLSRAERPGCEHCYAIPFRFRA